MHFPLAVFAGWHRYRHVGCAILGAALALPAFGMRILVTNDDGFESRNIQALYAALKAAGHEVLMSAPLHEQSGMSAALGQLSNFGPTNRPSPGGTIAAGSPGVGPTTLGADQFYVDGTPVGSVIHGLEQLSYAKWGALPDLVISGPNIGHNLGTVTPHSGTVGAAITALNWGVPAIAVSGLTGDADTAVLLAEITLRVLSAASDRGRIALPSGTGLNVNIPASDAARPAASYRYAFTQINTAGLPHDTHPHSERNVIADGVTVTVSPIQGTYQAPPEKAALVLGRMRTLFASSIPIINPKLVNVSVRGAVGTGSAVQVIGLVVTGTANKTILVRAAGPALTPFGISGSLVDPILEVYDKDNRLVGSNDNWGDDPAAAATISTAVTRLGAFTWTAGSRDAALVVNLAPGAYTAVVRGAGNTTGIALIEAYDFSVD